MEEITPKAPLEGGSTTNANSTFDTLRSKEIKEEVSISESNSQGKPAELTDVHNPDWVPSVAVGYGKIYSNFERGQKALQGSARLASCNSNSTAGELVPSDIADQEPSSLEDPQDESCKSVQTDITADEFSKYNDLQRLNQIELSRESLKGDDDKTEFYTGLHSFKLLEIVVEFIESYITVDLNSSLGAFEQVILTLVKLRLNLDFQDIAYRFNVCPTLAAKYFKNIVKLMYLRYRTFIIWPEREISQKTMPSCFIEAFNHKISVIIVCFELHIERPSSLLTAAQCWSNYEHHHTVKYFIGITPQGTVCFISEGLGGRVTDKMIIESSGFLNKIIPGDLILADRGSIIREYAQFCNADVKMYAFTKGDKEQLHPIEIEETRALRNVQIHVETLIDGIRQKFKILTDEMPISLVSCGVGDDVLLVDQIVTVCSVLTNLCPAIVPL